MRSAYMVIGLVLALAIGAGANLALKVKGPRAVWSVCALAALVVGLLGFIDWRAQVTKETPVHTYVLLAIVPALAAGIVALLLSRTPLPLFVRSSLSAAVWLLAAYGMLFSAFYP